MSSVPMACPRCGHDADLLATPACAHCGWSAPVDDGVVNLITDVDLKSSILASYFANYDQIASDDLTAPILNLSYVENQARNMARYAGGVTDQRILDLGCGQGHLTRLFQQAGAKGVVAVDISAAYLKRLTGIERITPVLANAERLPFRQAFDLVVSTDVMEHVLNLGAFLVSVNHALRDDGVAIIRVPYRENLVGYSWQAGCKYEFVHLRTFNRRTLVDAVTGAGFAVERTWLDGFNLSSPRPFWFAARRRQIWYVNVQKWLVARLPDPTAVTRWPWWFAAIFMTPKEIVIRARKVRNLQW